MSSSMHDFFDEKSYDLQFGTIEEDSLRSNGIDKMSAQLEQISKLLSQTKNTLEEMAMRVEVIEQTSQKNLPILTRTWRYGLRKFGPKLFHLIQHKPRTFSVPEAYHRIETLPEVPVISIVTPNLNQGAFIERTILSVLNQNYPKLEYIINDGDSSDESVEIVRRYADQLAHWESAADTGQANAINLGFQRANGEILAYLNADDLLLPGSLHYVAKYFLEHEDVDVVYGHRLLIDEDDDLIGRWILPEHDEETLVYVDYIPQETMFWRRSAWERVGASLDESFSFALDWDLILRFRAAGMRMVRLPRFLGAFRVSSNQKTTRLMESTGKREMNRLRQRYLGHFASKSEIKRKTSSFIFRHWILDLRYRLGLIRF